VTLPPILRDVPESFESERLLIRAAGDLADSLGFVRLRESRPSG
jgi:hypothetical protein